MVFIYIWIHSSLTIKSRPVWEAFLLQIFPLPLPFLAVHRGDELFQPGKLDFAGGARGFVRLAGTNEIALLPLRPPTLTPLKDFHGFIATHLTALAEQMTLVTALTNSAIQPMTRTLRVLERHSAKRNVALAIQYMTRTRSVLDRHSAEQNVAAPAPPTGIFPFSSRK